MELIALIVVFIILILISIATPLFFLLELIGWTWTGVPYVPVPKSALAKLPEAITLTRTSIFYDLGCGDGRVLYELAKHSDARFIGVEKGPLPYLLAIMRGWFSKQKNVRIIFGDISKVPLQDATHVYTYLLSRVMDRLLPKFETELRPGAVVVSCDFKFKNRPFQKTFDAPKGNTPHTLYIYNF